jgi:hypothetical protein
VHLSKLCNTPKQQLQQQTANLIKNISHSCPRGENPSETPHALPSALLYAPACIAAA